MEEIALANTGFEDRASPPELAVPVVGTEESSEAFYIKLRQAKFDGAMAALIGVYRNVDRKRRLDLKLGLRELYERLVNLGEALGVSRQGVDNLWKG